MNSITYQKALEKASTKCSKREYCKADAMAWAKQWGIQPNEEEKIISELEKGKYIDEARYARAFVNDKFRFNKWGRVKIKFHLKGKNIPESIIQKSLEEIDEDKYLDVLKEILLKKSQRTRFANDYEKMGKLIQHAQNRGFEYELAKNLIDEETKRHLL